MLIDAHAHLDRYGDSLDAALREIREGRIFTLSNSMDLPSYRRNLEIAAQCPWVFPSFGIHPWAAPDHAGSWGALDETVASSPYLGEIGLDYHFVEEEAQYPKQREIFERFLAAAAEHNKVVTVHTKGAEADVLGLLEAYRLSRVIVHWYSGPPEIFREMVDRGYLFTIGVEVFSSEPIRELARALPSTQILTETDNPGAWQWLRGTPGWPSQIRDVGVAIASLRGVTPEAVHQGARENLSELFRDDPWMPDSVRQVLEGEEGG
ncbi:MAG: TatD family hydrolase [Planctomycetota bacterium]|jgi:TatD DNase family protein